MKTQSFATRAFAVIGRANKVLREQHPTLTIDQANAMITALAGGSNQLGKRYSAACNLLRKQPVSA